ncbi:MAG: NTP transferase domain-containing protein [Chloroflexi bacterium]|nr:NTP transferase domain-containing protein [Chloroflexota bacterium]
MNNVVAMVLAGGQGKRMDILCEVRPKPALPFAGRMRVIDFTLSNCIHSQIGNIAVLTDYQREYLGEYLMQWRRSNPGVCGFDTLEPPLGSYRGTADAVYQNIDYLDRLDPEGVMVLAGDHVYAMDYRRMMAFHRETGADVTVGVMRVPLAEANRFGIVTPDAQGRIVDFAEKPAIPASNLASMGIYIFKTRVLLDYLEKDYRDEASRHDFGYSIIPWMIQRQRAFAYPFDGYWRDIGTVETYFDTHMELICHLPPFTLNDNWPVLTRDREVQPPRISETGVVKHSLVGPGCLIDGLVENSVLSPGVVVGPGAVVRNSVVMERSVVGKGSLVDRCILDEGVRVGNCCYVGRGTNSIQMGWGITLVGKSATVPSWTDVGRNLKVLPEVDPASATAEAESVISPWARG